MKPSDRGAGSGSQPPEDLAAFFRAEIREIREHLSIIERVLDVSSREVSEMRRPSGNVRPIRREDERDLRAG